MKQNHGKGPDADAVAVVADSVPVAAAAAAAVSTTTLDDVDGEAAPANSSVPPPSHPSQSSVKSYAAAADREIDTLANKAFTHQAYWEERFKVEEEYDWLCEYSQLEPRLLELLGGNRNADILVIGCGNSTFSTQLFDAGFHNITNIDFAASVIERMAAENAETRPAMRWLVMDMLDMATFEDGQFDMVIGKGLSLIHI